MPVTSKINGIVLANTLPLSINTNPHMSSFSIVAGSNVDLADYFVTIKSSDEVVNSTNFFIPSESSLSYIARANLTDFGLVQMQILLSSTIDGVLVPGKVSVVVYCPSSDILQISDIKFVKGISPSNVNSAIMDVDV